MEIEKKLGISSKRKANTIWRSLRRSKLDWIGKAERLAMRADYFDTDDGRVRANHLAFRVRREGPEIVATLKGKGNAIEGLHSREEENLVLNSNLFQRRDQKRFFRNPPSDLFKGTPLGDEAAELLDGKALSRIVEMRFTRRKQQVRCGGSVMEVSVDTGVIKGPGYRNAPICELEVELIDGSPDDVLALSGKIAETYGLEPENRSKLSRGLALAEEGK